MFFIHENKQISVDRIYEEIKKYSKISTKKINIKNIDFTKNSHLKQVTFENFEYLEKIPIENLYRILTNCAPEKPFTKIPHECRSVNHWGQRKLFISELEFLSLYSNPGDLVVYAGAAPGTHTNFLSELFPNLTFFLVDPSPFIAKETDKIKIKQSFFTDETCKESSKMNKSILFISDIRTGDPYKLSNVEVEKSIKNDMEMQKNWVKLLKPKASMLKFRLPWEVGKTSYLNGKIFFPVWGRETTTECRLITTLEDLEKGEILYNNKKYEEQMFYFNRVTRVQYYDHPFDFYEGLDHCYDCAAEIKIIKDFIGKENNKIENNKVIEMIESITKNISKGRNLTTKETFDQRKKWFSKK
jgi:Poly A polymerase regulatory subunit